MQTLKQQVDDLGAEGGKQNEKLRGEIQQLEADNARLDSEVESLRQQVAAATATADVATAKAAEEAASKPPESAGEEQVEEMKVQLQARHAEEREVLVAEMDAKRTTELTQLQAQYEAELHGVKEELSRVQTEREEERGNLQGQLATEAAGKQVS